MAASLRLTSYTNAGSTSATASYSVSGYSLPSGGTTDWSGDAPSGGTWTQTRVTTEYRDLSYSWSFGETGSSGTHTFYGLTAGSSNYLSGTVTISCQTRQNIERRSCSWIDGTPATETSPGTPGHWGSWSSGTTSEGSWSNHSLGSESVSLTVYTKPSSFSWSGNVNSGQTIQLNLSSSDWNTLCTKAAQRRNWINQSSGASVNATVSSGEIISAGKYNTLATALGVSNVSQGDVIRASHFTALSSAVNA